MRTLIVDKESASSSIFLKAGKLSLIIIVCSVLLSAPSSLRTRASDSATVTVTITFLSPEKATVSMSALEKFTFDSRTEGSRTDGGSTSLTLRSLTENSNGAVLVGGSGDKQQSNQDKGQNQGTQDGSVRIYYDDSI